MSYINVSIDWRKLSWDGTIRVLLNELTSPDHRGLELQPSSVSSVLTYTISNLHRQWARQVCGGFLAGHPASLVSPPQLPASASQGASALLSISQCSMGPQTSPASCRKAPLSQPPPMSLVTASARACLRRPARVSTPLLLDAQPQADSAVWQAATLASNAHKSTTWMLLCCNAQNAVQCSGADIFW